MKDPLATYLHDHLAGATFAIELLTALRDHQSDERLSEFAKDLLLEVEEDRVALEQLSNRVQADSGILKEAISWLTEKASRLKLRRQVEGSLGTFETLEALALGILGKETLWTTLAHLSAWDSRLTALNYPSLIARAQDQHSKVEAKRIAIANTTFAPG